MSRRELAFRLKSLGESAVNCEREISNIREDLRTRTSTRGDGLSMTLEKETFHDRTKAGRSLVFLAAALRPFTSTKPIGSIAGFPISLQRLEVRTNLVIHGKYTYQAKLNDNALGTIASLEHALASISELLHERETDLQRYHKQSEDMAKQLGQPFKYEENLPSRPNASRRSSRLSMSRRIKYQRKWMKERSRTAN